MKSFEVSLNDDFKITRSREGWYEIKCRKHDKDLIARTHWRVFNEDPSSYFCEKCKNGLSKELFDKAAFIINYYGEEGA